MMPGSNARAVLSRGGSTNMPQRLFRVAEGEAVEVPTANAAVVPGRYDKTNWGTDWMLFTAPDAGSARMLASRYDAALNQGRISRPRYLKSLSNVKAQNGIPTQYTPAQVRVNPKGGLDIKFSRPPKGKTKNPRGFSVI